MSGRKINDHSFWAGGKSKGSVFPEGAKVKHESLEEGAGELKQYEDTTEAIKTQQAKGKSKIEHHGRHPSYRN